MRNLTLHNIILQGTWLRAVYYCAELRKNTNISGETKNETILTHWSVAQAGSNDEKNWGRKSYWTVPLKWRETQPQHHRGLTFCWHHYLYLGHRFLCLCQNDILAESILDALVRSNQLTGRGSNPRKVCWINVAFVSLLRLEVGILNYVYFSGLYRSSSCVKGTASWDFPA